MAKFFHEFFFYLAFVAGSLIFAQRSAAQKSCYVRLEDCSGINTDSYQMNFPISIATSYLLLTVFYIFGCKPIECACPKYIKENTGKFEDLSMGIIFLKDSLKIFYPGVSPNTAKFNVNTFKISQKNSWINNINKQCQFLKLKGFFIDESNVIYYFVSYNTNFFQGEAFEEKLIFSYYKQPPSVNLNDNQVVKICDIALSAELTYVRSKIIE